MPVNFHHQIEVQYFHNNPQAKKLSSTLFHWRLVKSRYVKYYGSVFPKLFGFLLIFSRLNDFLDLKKHRKKFYLVITVGNPYYRLWTLKFVNWSAVLYRKGRTNVKKHFFYSSNSLATWASAGEGKRRPLTPLVGQNSMFFDFFRGK